MNTKRLFPENLSGPADNNERQSDTLSGTINVRAIMSTDLDERPTSMHSRRKGMLKRLRRWTGKKLTAICPVWSGHRRTSNDEEVIKMDTNRNLSELSTGLNDNKENQIDALSGTMNVTDMMSTDLNEQSTTVPSYRKDVCKRFRRWAGKRSRAIRRVWHRRQQNENHVGVSDNNENKSSNNDVVQNTNHENASKIIEVTEDPSLTTNKPETVINSTPTDQQFGNVENVCNSNVDAISYLPSNDTIMVETNVTSQDENTESLDDNLSEAQLTQMASENLQISVEQNYSSTAELLISERDQLDDLQIINPTASRQVDPTSKDNKTSLANVTVRQEQQQPDSISKLRSDNKRVEASTSNGPINNNSIGSGMNGNGGRVEKKVDPVFKCWKYRYNLFSKFDAGVMLDRGSLFFGCPEVISKHIAVSCRFDVAINPFCGAGGTAIQLAMVCKSVIAMDVDADKIKLAKFNATLYGVRHKIKFVVGDFFATGDTMKADIVVATPPWGRGFWTKNVFPLSDVCRSHGGAENIMRIAKTIAPRVLMRFPTNASIDDCVRLGDRFEMTNLEKCSLDDILNCLIVRFCSLTSWYNFRKTVHVNGHERGGRNPGNSHVRRPRFCNTLVRLRSTGLQSVNGQREEQRYFKEYMDSVKSFLTADDTNHSKPQNN